MVHKCLRNNMTSLVSQSIVAGASKGAMLHVGNSPPRRVKGVFGAR